jgi:hypothetical protein
LKLERSLKEEIIAHWEEAELEIKPYKDMNRPIILGGNITEV